MKHVDLTSARANADPYSALAELRETEPVHWHEELKGWCLTRHEDVQAAFTDPKFRSARIRQFVAGRSNVNACDKALIAESIGLWMVFNDPPRHTHLRKLTQSAFSLRELEGQRARIERLVDTLLEPHLDRGSMDFVSDFAYPLPATVIADLLGVPREHIEDLKRWSDDLAEFVLASRIQPEKFTAAALALEKMNALFATLLADKRRHPGTDLMDSLIGARDGRDALSEPELLAFCVLLLFAGHETTTHYFSNSLRALCANPDQVESLRRRADDRRALNVALDELLRFEGPVVAVSRVLGESCRLRGQDLRAGERVYLFTAAANRDPRAFERPDSLDLGRRDIANMLGFGFGIHLCLGIHLARLEAAVALPKLVRALPGLRVTREPEQWTSTLVIRGPRSLQIEFDTDQGARRA